MRILLISIVLTLGFISCKKDNPNYLTVVSDPNYFHAAMKQVTDIMVYDIFSPPVAGRIYSRCAIAGYEAMAAGDPAYRSLAGQVKDFPPMPKPEAGKEYAYGIASTKAIIKTGLTLLFSEDKMNAYEAMLLHQYDSIGVPKDVLQRSWAFGDSIGNAIIKWTNADNYKQSRTFPKFSVTNDPERWKPTPPAYMDAIEPHWNKQRPLIMDSAAQFKPVPPTPYSTDNNSLFYKEAADVMVEGNSKDSLHQAIALFWDCNPFIVHQQGHVMFATKKISPGGHWIGITETLCKKLNKPFGATAEAYALVAIGLNEGFISCWDEKYRSNLVRPETYINEHIDPEWIPLLQTPPFPEYTSGHSVVSSVSAEILTQLFGDNIAYTDSVEVEYGLFPRSFTSPKKAAQEACISRFYGGIHYMPAINNGITQGVDIGKFVMDKIKTKN
ncbi:MAG: vanadium-dependent haloperoxidase [Saprospiraceae bacterium]|nr:vanadium-dependent haloperoxidase [Saprospiraceae bacterium]